jgi:AraC family transcriptional regulator of adaptative response / DNA-3-methyladenine glycosylase II
VLAEANLESIGLTRARGEAIRGLARAVCNRKTDFDGIVDSEAFLARLCELPGIGKWTAQYVAMRALGEPDAFPSGDLGLRHALNVGSSRELEERAEAWRPWRAYAAMYLWSGVTTKGSRASKASLSRDRKNSYLSFASELSGSTVA